MSVGRIDFNVLLTVQCNLRPAEIGNGTLQTKTSPGYDIEGINYKDCPLACFRQSLKQE